MKSEGISKFYYPNLSDWEILSAITYCNKVVERRTPEYEEEYFNLCLLFFNGNEQALIETVTDMIDLYMKEYSNRHIN